jgi:hypothetical protein
MGRSAGSFMTLVVSASPLNVCAMMPQGASFTD